MDDNAWTKFDDFKREAFAVIHTSFGFPVTSENWAFEDCDCANGFKLFVCGHMIGTALRLKKIISVTQRPKQFRLAKYTN